MNWTAPDMDWNQIKAFLATVETGSLSGAARVLGLTQPTISRQIAALEKSLGVVLFERVGRSVALTPTGRDLLEQVRTMGDAANRLSLLASGQSQTVEGLVRITASDIVAAYVLPKVLHTLYDKAPGIQVEVIASNSINDLLRREADIAIRHVQPAQDDLVARRCSDNSAALYAADKFLQRYGRPRRREDLADLPFVGFTDADTLLTELNARGVPVTAGNFRWMTENLIVAWEMVRQGLGIGVMFHELAQNTPGVSQVIPDFDRIPVPVWIVTHRELHTSRRIRLVFDVLTGAFAGGAPLPDIPSR